MKFSNLTLAQRFAALLTVVLIGFAAYGACSFKVLADLKVNGPAYERIVQGKDLIADILPPPEYIIESYLVSLQAMSATPEQRKPLIENLKSLKNDYDTRHAYWASTNLDATLRGQLLEKADKPAMEFYKVAFGRFVPALEKGDTAEANAALDVMKASYAEHRTEINKLVELANKRNEDDEAGAKRQITASTWTMFGILIASVTVVALFLGVIAKRLTSQLGGEPGYATSIAHRIAGGDLTVSIETRSGDEESLLAAMKDMRNKLTTIVSQVRGGTDAIASASGQIASGNMDLSNRTEAQAGALEETASSMEELTSTVKQNADNSRQANQLAALASDVAVKGGAVVSQVIDTMQEINDSARKIVDIIGVIDGIAFQTNILALNAAVEAARAGEQGRGFAVVATEVRNLAQRSAAAAKEIKTLIGNSVDRVEAGSKLVNMAGATMADVVTSVKRVSDIISEITAASQEQTAGIEQINQAISQMDEVTQQNAALVEQAAAAAGSMQEQSVRLVDVVRVFKMDQSRSVPVLPSAASETRTRAPVVQLNPPRPAVPKQSPPRIARAVSNGDWEEF